MAEIQHYVPQSALRRFCDNDGLLHVFDKQERRRFRSNPRNVAAERDFYTIEATNGTRVSLEEHLAALEGDAAQVVDAVLERREVGSLSNDERRTLSTYAAIQHVRIQGHRARFRDMMAQLVRWIRRSAPADADLSSLPDPDDDTAIKLSAMKFVSDAVSELAPHFYSKTWLLFEAVEGQPFWVSDSPVTLHNSVPARANWMSNIGLAVTGIEIYLPVSSAYTLGFICPSITAKVLAGHQDSLLLRHVLGEDMEDAEGIGYLADGVRYGLAVPAQPEHMTLMNSLQVAQSERWVFACEDGFELAETMLNEYPELATGPRMRIG